MTDKFEDIVAGIEDVEEPPKQDMVVIVFGFPQPEDRTTVPLTVGKARELFTDFPDLKVYAGIRDAADEVLAIFAELHEDEESNWVKHAKRELAYAGNDEPFNQAIMKAVRGFASYGGHSGGSFEVAAHILNEILHFRNLTPLTDNPDEWIDQSEISGEPLWQNVRNGEAFSEDGGKSYWLLSEGAHSGNRAPVHVSETYTAPQPDDEGSKEG